MKVVGRIRTHPSLGQAVPMLVSNKENVGF